MTLPNFLVIGAMKAGTTSLYQYLRGHPDSVHGHPKELHFFSCEARVRTTDWYRARFADAGAATAVGEASASYTTYPDSEAVPDTDRRHDPRRAPDLPDPASVDRMRSHYLHRVGEGKESPPIGGRCVDEPDLPPHEPLRRAARALSPDCSRESSC